MITEEINITPQELSNYINICEEKRVSIYNQKYTRAAQLRDFQREITKKYPPLEDFTLEYLKNELLQIQRTQKIDSIINGQV